LEKELSKDQGPVVELAITSDFKEVIEESKAAIQNASVAPPKARRGRQRLPRDASGNIIRDPSKVSGRVVPDQSSTANPSAATPPPDISKSLIAPIKMLGKYPAKRFKIPELAFDDDECKALAVSINELYAVFAPNGQITDPRLAALANFTLVGGTIFVTKYQIYLEKRPKPTAEQPPVEEILPQGQTFPHINAEDAFRRRQ